MTEDKSEFTTDGIYALAQELAQALCSGDNHRGIIAAMVGAMQRESASETDIIKLLSAALLLMSRAQDQAAGAGAIVAIKLLALLMPGRDMHEVADQAFAMLRATANGDAPSKPFHVVIVRRSED